VRACVGPLLLALMFLIGCTKEPSMYEKCFDAEKGKLETLSDEALYAGYGYSPALHDIVAEASDQLFALDQALLVNLEEKRRVVLDNAKKRQQSNPLYQEYERLYDQYKEEKCCDSEWSTSFDLYIEAQEACEADTECFVYLYQDPKLEELGEANPAWRIWGSFADDADAVMLDRDWSAILGEDHEVEEYMENFFHHHFLRHPKEILPDDEVDFSELSADEAIRQEFDSKRIWFDYWLGEFEVKQQAVFAQFDGVAREVCNTRGLYE
jgi:hypothetical protein